MHRRTTITWLACLGLFPALLIACGDPPPATPTVTSLPAERQLLLGAQLSDTGRDYELLLLNPGDPEMSVWQLQGGRGLTENGRSCISADDARAWDAGARPLTFSGCFGEQTGLNVISADGEVTNLARLTLLAEPDPITRSSTKEILRDGAVELPRGVEYLKSYRHARLSDAFAFAGSIYGSQPSESRAYLYIADEQNRVTVYGEEHAFSESRHIRWAPDERALSFVGVTGLGEASARRAYYLDLDSGAAEPLSDAEVPLESAAEFTSDGGIIFAGSNAGAGVALYFAAPGETAATPLVSLASIPQIERWSGRFLLSPDETRVAFEAQRDNPTTPWTLYSADLDSGAVSDLLPPDLEIQRSGTTAGADSPYAELLAWHPDGQQIVFASSLSGRCNNNNGGGVVNCTRQIYTVAADGGAPAYLSATHLITVGFALWLE